MTEQSPLTTAQQSFVAAIPFRGLATETVDLFNATGRVTAEAIAAPIDSPPYPRSIVEGFVVATSATKSASEENPVGFEITSLVQPGDTSCPQPTDKQAIEVMTGSVVPAGDFSVVRMFEAKRAGNTFTISRPFPPGFFIETQGCDIQKGQRILEQGRIITARDIGALASLGIAKVNVIRQPKVTVYASGNEVVPHDQAAKVGEIRDCNTPMLAAAIREAGGVAAIGGIQQDDFEQFVDKVRNSLDNSDMVVISGGTAVGGRDFISDLIRELGELIVDGVPMRSGRPLIMGVSKGKPIVCVAGHPPEALRGFQLFGVAAMHRLLGLDLPLPEDPSPPGPPPGKSKP